jgi:hypothetical protein
MEEVNEVNKVQNGIDSPNLLSVDSTSPIEFVVDKVENDEHKVEGTVPPVEEKKEPTAEEKVAEDTKKLEVEKAEEEKKKPEVEVAKKPEDPLQKRTEDPVQKRINIAVKKQRVAERERDFLKSSLTRAEEELSQLKSKLSVEDKPNREDFEEVSEYAEAVAIWAAKKEVQIKEEAEKKAEVDNSVKQSKETMYSALDDALDAGRTKYEDFDTVALNSELQMTEDLVETILDSEIAEEIMYYLGKNPDESADLSKLSPRRAAREVTKIEAKLLAVATKVEEPPKAEEIKTPVPKQNEASLGGLEGAPPEPKKVTKAPEPIDPPRASGVTDKDPNTMGPKEYRAWRERNK